MKSSASKKTLVFDCGNSTISMAFFEKGDLKEMWKIPSVDLHTLADFEVAIIESFPQESIFFNLKSVIASSVVASKTETFKKAINNIFAEQEKHFVSINERMPLINGYVPSELGADLYANAIEARVKKPSLPTIVVDFGTALTFILTDDNGVIRGVSIAPGVKTSLRSLYKVAPVLENHTLSYPLTVLGGDTDEAMNAGIFYMTKGGVKETIKEMESELGAKTYKIATGGHSKMFAPFVGIFDEIDDAHTLKGMYSLFNF